MTKTIIITRASSGIGKATATHFADKGWNVVATMRNIEDAGDLANRENVLVSKVNVTDLQTITDTVAATLEKFRTIDVLVNNAGYGNGGPLEAVPTKNIRKQFDVNVFGLIDMTKAVLPTMKKNKSGTIVNISSIGGRVTLPFFSPYHGTKWAVEGITESLQYELEPAGIKVKLVEPGAIKTDFAGRSLDFVNDESMTEYQETLGKFMTGMTQGMEMGAEPEMVAQVIDNAIHGDKLRYLAGADGEAMMKNRNEMTDTEYLAVARQRFRL